jgi:peptide chain release factor 3
MTNNDYILGAVGVLQFDVIIARLKDEYGVEAIYEPVQTETARWVTCAQQKLLDQFVREFQANMALDAEGALAYLAPSRWRLDYTMEQWPDIVFHTTREKI